MAARAEMLGDTGREPPGQLGGRPGEPGPSRHRHPLRARRGGARALPSRAPSLLADCAASSALLAGSGSHAAVRLCARPLRLPRPAVAAGDRGLGRGTRRPGRAPRKPGEFILGYPDEDGPSRPLPQPEILSRNGSYLAYRRLEEHVGAFRDFLREHGKTPDGEELLAAKLMGRWRSGAPLVLAPDKDDPALGADPAQQQLRLQEDGPAWLCGAARLAHPRG